MKRWPALFPKGHCAHGSFGRSVSRYTQPTDFTGKDANHLKAWERIRNDLTWVDSDNRGKARSVTPAAVAARPRSISKELIQRRLPSPSPGATELSAMPKGTAA
jgi:hypothetical protein